MLKALQNAARERRSASNSRRSSLQSTPYGSVYSDETFSSFSDDSESDRCRRGRRKAVTKRKTTKPNSGKVAPAAAPAKIRGVSQEPVPKPRAKAKAKAPAKAKAEPVPPIDELVKIVKKEGSTRSGSSWKRRTRSTNLPTCCRATWRHVHGLCLQRVGLPLALCGLRA